ncbi:HAD-IIB family hydrolase [Micromonospora soli]|uniref:HAD-IIB family hydrolase n=1 Tax=Micromonospora sp. NBRC 110009 TaxID=3061627 RepID=UPI0026721D4E|nr:HAD-IIB family hydrolase [Micromonospora sp. NBRC 110009]WKU00408.1 HAD-IIB family hydrolase [Micromonospora sp. NBRC 110009]
MNDLRVVAFDLDDTLAVSKSRIDRRMAELLAHLLTEVDVLIISGGRFEQFEAQVLAHLDLTEEQRGRLHLMPTCGTRYYRWQDGEWRLVYAEDLSEADKARVIEALTESAKALGLWEPKTWGDIIEDRGSQITFSALGQSAPPAEKYGWDPDGSKKKRLRDAVAEKLPDLEVRGGGSTSIDVTRKGVDKAYGMRKLLECLDLKTDNVLFVGDRLDAGGNDYPVKAMGIRCMAVTCWEETADYVETLVDELVQLRAEPA